MILIPTLPAITATGPVVFKASAAGNNIAIPSHKAGDLLVLFMSAATYSTVPAATATVPAWTLAGKSPTPANGNECRVYYAVATRSDHTTGSWPVASPTVVVLSGQSANPIGAKAFTSAYSQGGVVVPAVTPTNTSGTGALIQFWNAGVWLHTTDGVNLDRPPSIPGYTLRQLDFQGGLATKDDTTTDGSIIVSGLSDFNYHSCQVEVV